MIKNFKIFENIGRPKDKWVRCIKNFAGILGDYHVTANPHLQYNVRNLYPFFEKDKIYKMKVPFETYNDNDIVCIETKIKHSIGPPDYEKFITQQFIFNGEVNDVNNYWRENYFEDYFEMSEETKKLIDWWYIKKDAKKYNI